VPLSWVGHEELVVERDADLDLCRHPRIVLPRSAICQEKA
jgi:hypothetical protein